MQGALALNVFIAIWSLNFSCGSILTEENRHLDVIDNRIHFDVVRTNFCCLRIGNIIVLDKSWSVVQIYLEYYWPQNASLKHAAHNWFDL